MALHTACSRETTSHAISCFGSQSSEGDKSSALSLLSSLLVLYEGGLCTTAYCVLELSCLEYPVGLFLSISSLSELVLNQ